MPSDLVRIFSKLVKYTVLHVSVIALQMHNSLTLFAISDTKVFSKLLAK